MSKSGWRKVDPPKKLKDFFAENPGVEFTEESVERGGIELCRQVDAGVKSDVEWFEKKEQSVKKSASLSKDELIYSVLDGTLTAGEAVDKLLNGRKLSSSQLSKLLSDYDLSSEFEKDIE